MIGALVVLAMFLLGLAIDEATIKVEKLGPKEQPVFLYLLGGAMVVGAAAWWLR